MVEYAMLLSLVALALVGTIGGMAGQVGGRFNAISNTLGNGLVANNGGHTTGNNTPGNNPGATNPPTNNNGNNQAGNNNAGNNNGSSGNDSSNNGAIDPSKTPLDKVGWDKLDELSKDAAKNPDKYKDWIGQKKTDENGNEWVLVGTNHDELADGSGKAGFTFMSRKSLGKAIMNKTWNYEYKKLDMNLKTLPNVFSKLPKSIQKVAKEVKKSNTDGSDYTNKIDGINQKLYLPSKGELGYNGIINDNGYNDGEDYNPNVDTFAYFWKSHTNIKLFLDTYEHFWTRSFLGFNANYHASSFYEVRYMKYDSNYLSLEYFADTQASLDIKPCFSI